MEPNRFDTVTRTLFVTGSRRRLFGLLAALPLVGEAAAAERPVNRLLDRRRHRPEPHPKHHKDGKGHKPHKDPRPKSHTCSERGKACTTPSGTRCCPSVDPNVVCAGGNNPARSCQDCSAAPTAAGAFCQDPPGNQCCGGKPGNFVGIRVEDDTPACYSTGVCRTLGEGPCTADTDCAGSLECVQGSLVPCGCAGTTPTFCGTPSTG